MAWLERRLNKRAGGSPCQKSINGRETTFSSPSLALESLRPLAHSRGQKERHEVSGDNREDHLVH